MAATLSLFILLIFLMGLVIILNLIALRRANPANSDQQNRWLLILVIFLAVVSSLTCLYLLLAPLF
ncbi:MAG: hypothetical protein ACK2UW_11995 [Anaerolineales bacterium]